MPSDLQAKVHSSEKKKDLFSFHCTVYVHVFHTTLFIRKFKKKKVVLQKNPKG